MILIQKIIISVINCACHSIRCPEFDLMREGGVALVSVNLEFNPLKLGAADDDNFRVGRLIHLNITI